MSDEKFARNSISVGIATLDRPDYARSCVEYLLAGDQLPDEILLVDQSKGDETLEALKDLLGDRVKYVKDSPPGLSRARNRAVAETSGDYVALIDDDVELPPGWLASLNSEIERFGHPDALYGALLPDRALEPKEVELNVFRISTATEWTKPTHPYDLGIGAHTIVRRPVFDALGGFDVALGLGTDAFGAEDMDFNYRLLKAGYRAVSTPDIWFVHHQHRSADDLPRLIYRYNFSFSIFCMKHLRMGDRRVLRMFAHHAVGDLRMLGSALRRRSTLRARVAAARAAGTWRGLFAGLRIYFGRRNRG